MLIQLLINIIAFYVTGYIVPGITISSWPTLIVMSIVWGVLTLTMRPILLILALPINILTLGLFTFVINALLLQIMSVIVPGFHLAGFWTALVAAIVLALVNMFLSTLVK